MCTVLAMCNSFVLLVSSFTKRIILSTLSIRSVGRLVELLTLIVFFCAGEDGAERLRSQNQ